MIPAELFNHAERVVSAEVQRRGLKPHVADDGHLRGVWGPSEYKKTEVAIVPVNADRGFFRNAEPAQDIDIFIFTDCAGRFWIVPANEVRAV
jgi:hypothetical protein